MTLKIKHPKQNPAMDIHIHGYPWIFRIKYYKQSNNCKMTAKLTKYSGITLQLINFDCL